MDYKVLITGANGQLGSVLYGKLQNIFNLFPTSATNLNNSKYIKLDITKTDNVKSVLNSVNPDLIINTAAITDVDYCENNKSKVRAVNVQGLKNL